MNNENNVNNNINENSMLNDKGREKLKKTLDRVMIDMQDSTDAAIDKLSDSMSKTLDNMFGKSEETMNNKVKESFTEKVAIKSVVPKNAIKTMNTMLEMVKANKKVHRQHKKVISKDNRKDDDIIMISRKTLNEIIDNKYM